VPNPSSEYAETAASGELAGLVDAWWRRQSGTGGDGAAHRVLPDGCVDILLDLQHARAYVVGTMTRAVVVPPGDGGPWFSVRFRPGGAASVLGPAVAALTNARIELSELRVDAGELIERVVGAPDAARPAAFEAWLAKARSARRVEPLVARAVDRLLAAGAPSVEALASELGVTRQHLTRSLRAHVGIGAKELARVGRMKRAVAAIDAGRPLGWADFAIDAGFYDQSHLIAEMRALTGLTPGELAVERRGSISPIPAERRVA
jgi:AraC-like DNA-binding protein